MKKLIITFLLIPLLGMAQSIENINYISPFHDGVAAIKKGNEWAFIDQAGKIVVGFRNDLVLTKTENENYPIFNSDRCLITNEKGDVSSFRYMDKTGKTVITPKFLNATNFENDKALALKVEKETIGYNDIFNKDVVNYHYFEVVIDEKGNTIDQLTQLAIHIAPKDKNDENPLAISSKFISRNLIAVKGSDNKWSIKKID